MNEREALIAAIAARPADDLPRLVFADWLEDGGDAPQAEFIRAHLRLAKLRPGTKEFEAVAKLCDESFISKADNWWGDYYSGLGCMSPMLHRWKKSGKAIRGLTKTSYARIPKSDWQVWFKQCCYQLKYRRDRSTFLKTQHTRGFVEAVSLNATIQFPSFASVSEALRSQPTRHMKIVGSGGDAFWEKLDGPQLLNLDILTLELSQDDVEDNIDFYRSIFDSENLKSITTLSLGLGGIEERDEWRLQDDGMRLLILCESELIRRLKILRLTIASDVLTILTGLPPDIPLQELSANPTGEILTPDDWARLPMISCREKLRRLSLRQCELNDNDLLAITRVRRWDRLTHLRLDDNHFGDLGVAGMCRDCVFPEVRFLYLAKNQIGDAGAVAIARSGFPLTLRVLDLRENPISRTGAEPLAEALAGGPLTGLTLSAKPLGRRGVRRIGEILGQRVRFV